MVLLLGACSRKQELDTSVHFTTPGHPNLLARSMNQTLAAGTPTFCYFVNITGPGIPSSAGACSPAQGINAGFIPPSTSIAFTVPKGSGRTVEVFGYLAGAGQTCDGSKSLSSVPLNRLFRMGRDTGVDMSSDTVNVDITVSFPGVTQNYGIQERLAVACLAGLPAIPLDGGGVGTAVQYGSQYVVKGQIGLGLTSNVLVSGSVYKVMGSVSHVVQ